MTKVVPFARKSLPVVSAVLAVLLGTGLPVFGQGAELEPNNTCATAQDLGAVAMPYSVTGQLDSTPESPDVDFFRFSAAPGSGIQIDLERRESPTGSLGDPYMGVFSGGCTLIATNDDGGGSLNSRHFLTVPADGAFVVAATGLGDSDFTGGSNGAYTVRASRLEFIGSISGRAIDARTGQPLSGNYPWYAQVELQRCAAADCDRTATSVSSGYLDGEGRFRFVTDGYGNPLLVDTYRVVISASRYERTATNPTAVAEGEDLDLGDIPVPPIPTLGSISGRVVDQLSGAALPGQTSPRAMVELHFCADGSCYNTVASMATDGEGRFRFEKDSNGEPLFAGTYQVIARASQYEDGQTQQFKVGEDERRDVGDIALKSYPVRFTEIRPCGNLPSEGGDCRYSLRIANGQATPLVGGAWSIVTVGDYYGGSSSVFQAGGVRPVQLVPGASQAVQFRIRVPSTAKNGSNICAQVYAGQGDAPQFDILARHDLFCITKGQDGYRVLDEDETAQLLAVSRCAAAGVSRTK